MTNPDRNPPENRDRRRLDAVFGEVLPDTSSDERDPGAPEPERESWYRDNRPPHHQERSD